MKSKINFYAIRIFKSKLLGKENKKKFSTLKWGIFQFNFNYKFYHQIIY